MPGQRNPNAGMVVAREACVVIVGARPPVYETFMTRHNKTGEPVEMRKDQPSDPGSEGIPYAFKQYQRVPKNHPAVKTLPGAFIPIEDLDDAELELVSK